MGIFIRATISRPIHMAFIPKGIVTQKIAKPTIFFIISSFSYRFENPFTCNRFIFMPLIGSHMKVKHKICKRGIMLAHLSPKTHRTNGLAITASPTIRGKITKVDILSILRYAAINCASSSWIFAKTGYATLRMMPVICIDG